MGPTVTQYAFKPAEGVKLSKITTLSNNLALALADLGRRVMLMDADLGLANVDVLLGLTAKNMLLNIKYGITAYIGLVPIFLGVTLLTALVFHILKIPVEPRDHDQLFEHLRRLGQRIELARMAA
mgnify:CR=1 FL=1